MTFYNLFSFLKETHFWKSKQTTNFMEKFMFGRFRIRENMWWKLVIGQNEREEIDNETRCKIALSTIAVALNNTNCSVPCFVQVMDRYKDIFNGFSVGGGLRTNYEMIVLKVRKFQKGNVVSSNQRSIFPNFFPSIKKVVKNENWRHFIMLNSL